MYKPGDKIRTWFSENADGMSTVLKVSAYTGRYTHLGYKQVLKVTAPRTRRGWLELAVTEVDK